MKARILVVDDEADLCKGVEIALKRDGYHVESVFSGEEAVEVLQEKSFDLIILDYKMTGMDGLETLRQIRERFGDVSVIFITAHGDQELAIRSLELGATEYLHKPFNLKNLSFRIFKTLKLHLLETEIKDLKKNSRNSFSGIATRNEKMKEIMEIVDRVAKHSTPVLITGETGTGKEVIASAIHHNTMNPRKEKAFLTINCGAVPEPLIESELFGHVKGAFSGAVVDKQGLFEVADGGTIFLDELTSASPALQTKLLRILDCGEYLRVGDTATRKVDARVVAATNKDIPGEIEKGNFRIDLYHRLKVVQIELPPLRDRREDIEPLARRFLEIYNAEMGRSVSMSADALSVLKSYPWPGNIRELKHCMESVVLMCRGEIIRPEDLPERMRPLDDNELSGDFSEMKSRLLENFEKKYFASIIKEAGGNISKAADLANLSRVYLAKKLKEYGIDAKEEKQNSGDSPGK